MSEIDVKNFIIPNNQPVFFLDCNTAFENLNPKEKAYAHHLSRASFYGGLIVLVQVYATYNFSPVHYYMVCLFYRHHRNQALYFQSFMRFTDIKL